MPSLRVLGWDGADTPLKLAHVNQVLHDRLRWPDDPADQKAWREQWRAPFRHRIGHVIRTSDALAEVLAQLARNIRDRAKTMLAAEADNGPLRTLHKAFRTSLIHDLSEENFADTYAQTITYGLLTAAISRTDQTEGRYGTALIAENITDMVPVTNPFLKEMLQTFLKVGGRKGGIDFDELGVQDVVELLRGGETDLPAILRDFGNRTRGEDPVIHFYEHFLSAYNKKLKIQRGVFYTPQPVVSYIVRSVHELLQTEFGLEDGLASTATWAEMAANFPELNIPDGTAPDSPFVVILDPATGTATFLVEVIGVIHRTLMEKWRREGSSEKQREAAWNEYVPKHLLPRLYGYELMMAPYAIAHMKIGLKLHETGYRFGSEERARTYLTNALEPASDDKKQMEIEEWVPALAHEAKAVNAVKRGQRFTVVVGNPPYANYSANLYPEARRTVDKYRQFNGVMIRERNQLQFERNIQDDFVKFISIAEDCIRISGIGLLGYITNATMLTSASLRGMRESLANTFHNIFELNLHGGTNELGEFAKNDKNVFDIEQAVAIHVFMRGIPFKENDINYADLTGGRDAKYNFLRLKTISHVEWVKIQVDAENCGFILHDEADYGKIQRLDEVFVQFGAGIKTNRDKFVIGFDDDSLVESVREINEDLISDKNFRKNIKPLLYRPFDVRRIFYHANTVASRSLPTMKHFIVGPNIGLICSSTWTTPDRFSVNVSRSMIEMKTGTHDRGTTFFPLYRHEGLVTNQLERVNNLTQQFIKDWSKITKTLFLSIGYGDLENTSGPEDVLFWLYGLFYSEGYRRRYKAALSQGFPIVLLASNRQMVRTISQLGGELVSLHLLESLKVNAFITEFTGEGDNGIPKKPTYKNGAVWINNSQRFEGVPEAVWNFHIGGYQVCEKWLKDRKGRRLSAEDIAHYQKIVVALNETIHLMREIDETIDRHGGWPGAFQTADTSEPA